MGDQGQAASQQALAQQQTNNMNMMEYYRQAMLGKHLAAVMIGIVQLTLYSAGGVNPLGQVRNPL